jgi:methionyl-tRNA formyltransferase
MTSRIVVIGSGSFAVNCLKVLSANAGASIALAVDDPHARAMRGLLGRFCATVNIPLMEAADVNAPPTIEAIRAAKPDFVFSAYNMQILRRELLGIARMGTINFHNGPLPRYRGVNVYSWAIVNGETEYGVAWHMVDEGIDSGDIVGEARFPIAADERPTTLVAKGFKAGVQALEALLPGLLAGTLAPRKQDARQATYYARRDAPNGGWLDFDWPWTRIERFVRGLDFRPLENTLVHPTVAMRSAIVHPQAARLIDRSTAASTGAIVAVSDTAIHVQAADGVVALSDFLGADKRPRAALAPRDFGWRVGDRFDPVPAAAARVAPAASHA